MAANAREFTEDVTRPRVGTAGDERWRAHTRDANDAFNRGDTSRARALYEEALAEAERHLETDVDEESVVAPMLLVISLQNLAELERREGAGGRATELLLSAFARIAEIAERADAPDLLRAACCRNFEPALAELVADLTSSGRQLEIQPLLDRANAARRSVAIHLWKTPTS